MNKIIVSLVFMLLISGCGDPLLYKDVEDLQQEVLELKTTVRQLQKGTVVLDTTTPNFQMVNNGVGYCLIAFKSADPVVYGFELEGYNVKLDIGNSSNMDYDSFTLTVRYGKKLDLEDPQFDYEQWEKSLKEKEFDFSRRLPRGTWNPVQFTLPVKKVQDFKYLEVAMDVDRVSLDAQ